MTREQAEKNVDAIMEDILDRSGIGDEMAYLDEETRKGIRRTWVDVILEVTAS